ncbi:hypothetical protein [Edaphobacillus lindanitolerans]|uniref:Lipoprotein n=1 Tax=Edaphobacillus lindanitolerans TaxID=550447 RepID=A0A1U7PI22_9BACI|nr:hypothetical protein [Edaphobacillus lindanitolerans]SIT71151.1 hypothetical protein SAMN05428946_0690 [Edaphobacillus lindanitolerans]
MKKYLAIMATAALLLGACGDKQENPEQAPVDPDTEQNGGGAGDQTDKGTVTGDAGGGSSEDTIHDGEAQNAEPAKDTSGYEELEYVGDSFNPDDYEIRVASDNPGNRVLLFMEGEKPAYKTVYIKHEDLLKIISTDEGLLEQVNLK